MRKRSFRLRLALISAGLSGLVLFVFGVVAWWALGQSRLRSLDGELKTFGYRFASRSGPNVDGKRQEETMEGIFGTEAAPYRFMAFLRPGGDPIFRSAHWPDGLDASAYAPGEKAMDPQPDVAAPPPKEVRKERAPRVILEPRFYTAKVGGRNYRIGVFSNPEVILVCGADFDQFSRDMTQLRNAFLVALPGALLVIAFGAWWLGRKALRPIEALSEDMGRVSARALDQRLDPESADVEFAEIIESYNAMLERLERSFQQANRFSADASHELKTPLAIMRGTLEQGMKRCPDDPEVQRVFSQLLEQTGRQGAILESLLLLSRADAGKLEISSERIDLSGLLGMWLEDASLLAEPQNISITSDIGSGIEIEGDPVLLQRVAHNLFSNAVRYNREGGEIGCRLSKFADGVRWTLANTGEKISEGDRERVFDRFERSETPGVTDDVGVGLGLSLTREIIVAHGGEISVGENAMGMTEFDVRFLL